MAGDRRVAWHPVTQQQRSTGVEQRDPSWGDTASSFLDALLRTLAKGVPMLVVLLGVLANLVTALGPLYTPLLTSIRVPFLPAIGAFLLGHLDLWAALLGALTTALVLYTPWLSTRIRHRVLVLSQRRLPSLSMAVVIGVPVLLFFGLSLVLFPHLLSALAGVQHPPDSATVRELVMSMTLLVALGVAAGLSWVNQRMHISANQCRYVVQQIDDQHPSTEQPDTTYEFESGAPVQEIRRQGRILDVIAAKGLAGVRRAPYGWAYTLGVATDEQWAQLASSQTATERDWILTKLANEVWISAESSGLWRRIGGLAQPVQYVKIFGNRLDTLFNSGAGFRVYDAGGPRFVVMVIKGQPGAGKSTLGLQLCVTLAKQGNLCIYYSLEEERNVLLQSAKNFGWDRPEPHYLGVHSYTIGKSVAQVRMRQQLLKQRGRRQDGRPLTSSDPRQIPWYKQPEPPMNGIVLVSSLGGRAMRLSQRRKKLRREWGRSLKTAANLPEAVRCVVIDSLEGFANVGMEGEEQAGIPRDQLLHLKDFFRDRCEMLVLLLEDSGGNTAEYPEFVADVVIQLGRRTDDNYLFLFAEILKARNQTHALGQAQIKIRAQEELVNAREAIAEAEAALTPGIQVFPSLHYRLFQSKQESAFDEYTMSTGFSGLDEMFSDDLGEPGLRRKAAIALIGPRDSGKSLVGMNFLIQGVRENTKTLLLSLRDDAGTVRKRRIPQEPGQIRFSWQDMEPVANQPGDAPAKAEMFHQLEWDLDGVLKWAEDRSRPQPQTLRVAWRLPYLFALPPVTYTALMCSPIMLAEAEAVAHYLERLAGALRAIQQDFPRKTEPGVSVPEDSWQIEWTPKARERARMACQKAWGAFERDLAIQVVAAQQLVAHVERELAATIHQEAADSAAERTRRAKVQAAKRFFPNATGLPHSLSPDDEALRKVAEEQARALLLSDTDRQRIALTHDAPVPLDELEFTTAMAEIVRTQLQMINPTDPCGWKRLDLVEEDGAMAPVPTDAAPLSAPAAPPPCLRWDSRRWDSKQGQLLAGDDLLVVKPWRPGNITPDDFVDQVLRVIGEPPARTGRPGQRDEQDAESEFERVVVDDVAQLPQRFPILDKTRLFLPTLIDTFKARGMTSLFLADAARAPTIAAVEKASMAPNDTGDPYGLEVMADYVIRSGIASPARGQAPRLVLEVQAVPSSYQQAPHHLEFVPRPGGGPSMVKVEQ